MATSDNVSYPVALIRHQLQLMVDTFIPPCSFPEYARVLRSKRFSHHNSLSPICKALKTHAVRGYEPIEEVLADLRNSIFTGNDRLREARADAIFSILGLKLGLTPWQLAYETILRCWPTWSYAYVQLEKHRSVDVNKISDSEIELGTRLLLIEAASKCSPLNSYRLYNRAKQLAKIAYSSKQIGISICADEIAFHQSRSLYSFSCLLKNVRDASHSAQQANQLSRHNENELLQAFLDTYGHDPLSWGFGTSNNSPRELHGAQIICRDIAVACATRHFKSKRNATEWNVYAIKIGLAAKTQLESNSNYLYATISEKIILDSVIALLKDTPSEFPDCLRLTDSEISGILSMANSSMTPDQEFSELTTKALRSVIEHWAADHSTERLTASHAARYLAEIAYCDAWMSLTSGDPANHARDILMHAYESIQPISRMSEYSALADELQADLLLMANDLEAARAFLSPRKASPRSPKIVRLELLIAIEDGEVCEAVTQLTRNLGDKDWTDRFSPLYAMKISDICCALHEMITKYRAFIGDGVFDAAVNAIKKHNDVILKCASNAIKLNELADAERYFSLTELFIPKDDSALIHLKYRIAISNAERLPAGERIAAKEQIAHELVERISACRTLWDDAYIVGEAVRAAPFIRHSDFANDLIWNLAIHNRNSNKRYSDSENIRNAIRWYAEQYRGIPVERLICEAGSYSQDPQLLPSLARMLDSSLSDEGLSNLIASILLSNEEHAYFTASSILANLSYRRASELYAFSAHGSEGLLRRLAHRPKRLVLTVRMMSVYALRRAYDSNNFIEAARAACETISSHFPESPSIWANWLLGSRRHEPGAALGYLHERLEMIEHDLSESEASPTNIASILQGFEDNVIRVRQASIETFAPELELLATKAYSAIYASDEFGAYQPSATYRRNLEEISSEIMCYQGDESTSTRMAIIWAHIQHRRTESLIRKLGAKVFAEFHRIQNRLSASSIAYRNSACESSMPNELADQLRHQAISFSRGIRRKIGMLFRTTHHSVDVGQAIRELSWKNYRREGVANAHESVNIFPILHGKDLRVFSDKEIFDNILENILLNAIAATQLTPPPHWIWIEAMDTETELVIRIIDSGPGVDDSDIPRINEFLDEGGLGLNGSGFGLTYVKLFMPVAGGLAPRFENHDSGGLCVTLRFPHTRTTNQ